MTILDLYYFVIPPAASFAVFGLIWLLWGRDEAGGKDTVAVQITPPEGLGVMECGVLYDDILNTQDIALEILNLSSRGIIEITEEKIYNLKKGPDTPEYQSLSEGQKILLQTLFEDNPERILTTASNEGLQEAVAWYQMRKTVDQTSFTVSSLRKLAERIDELKINIYESLTQREYFSSPPHMQRMPYFAIAGIIFAGPLVLNIGDLVSKFESYSKTTSEFSLPWPLVFGLALAAIIISFIGSFMAHKTIKGKEARAYILGFKMFIRTAELDRIKFILQNDINAYRQIIPYAGLFNALETWLSPLENLEQNLINADYAKITKEISALDLESAFSERKRWPQAIFSLFKFGLQLLPKSRRRRQDFDL